MKGFRQPSVSGAGLRILGSFNKFFSGQKRDGFSVLERFNMSVLCDIVKS